MAFQTPANISGTNSYTLDLSQAASILNRRFYRQGINWAVAGFKIFSSTGTTGTIQISKLPNTWVLSNAWEKGFRAWQRQQREALEDGSQESVRAKFNDFKIHADSFHLTQGFSANLLPTDSLSVQALPGEWDASQIVIPNYGAPGVNYEPYLLGVGADVGGLGGAISLVTAYSNSRGVPQSPDPAVPAGVTNADNIYQAMFDVGDNNLEVLDNVVGKNDELPYDQLEYPGAAVNMPNLELHDRAFVTATTIGDQSNLKGGNFPCGLVRIQFSNTNDTTYYIHVDLIPGNHRGYLCEPMTEM
jgi:hypothetical protein